MRASALAILILLAGCERPVTHSEAESIARDAAGGAYNGRIVDLESRVDKLQRDKAALEQRLRFEEEAAEASFNYAKSVGADVKDLRETVSKNARVYNDHLRAER